MSDGSIRNTYDVRLRNAMGEERPFRITLTGDDSLLLQLEGLEDNVVYVPANETLLQRVYVVAPTGTAAAGTGRTDVRLWVEDIVDGDRVSKDTVFNGRVE
jgi:hypothetical protein